MEQKLRFQAKEAFLTYPQCALGKQIVYEHLLALGPKQLCVVQESHADGNPHLHAYVSFEKKKDWRDFHSVFDCQGQNANNAMRKDGKLKYAQHDWLVYLQKSDKEPLCNFDINAVILAQENHKRKPQEKNLEFLSQLEEKGVNQCVKEGLISIMNYKKVKLNFEEFKADTKVDEREELPMSIETPWDMFLDCNNEVKQCHYWFFSECPSLGKTTFGNHLVEKYKAQFVNYQEPLKFQSHITPETELIILDEYRGQMKISDLNLLCDGSLMFGKKGSDPKKLLNKAIVIVLSNKSPEEVYKNSDVSLIQARFNIINITNKKK